MNNLLSMKFLFNPRPGALSALFQNFFFTFLALFFILAVVFAVLKKRNGKNIYYKIWRKLYIFCLTNIFIGLIILFFIYELIPILSSRFWFLIWGMAMAVWLGFISKELAQIPKKRQQIEQEREYKKYIP